MFIENGDTSESEASQNVEIKEVRVQVPLTSASIQELLFLILLNHTTIKKNKKLMILRLTMNL